MEAVLLTIAAMGSSENPRGAALILALPLFMRATVRGELGRGHSGTPFWPWRCAGYRQVPCRESSPAGPLWTLPPTMPQSRGLGGGPELFGRQIAGWPRRLARRGSGHLPSP